MYIVSPWGLIVYEAVIIGWWYLIARAILMVARFIDDSLAVLSGNNERL
jgi:hypothetical protein